MGVRKDRVQVEVEIGGKRAGQTLEDLKKDSRQLYRELQKLTPGTEEFKQKLAELQASRKHLKEVQKDIKAIGEAFDSRSIGGLQGRVGELFQQIKRLIPGTEEFKAKLLELRSAKGALKEVEDQLGEIQDKLTAGTLGAIKQEVTDLEAELDKLSPGTEAFRNKLEDLKKSRVRLQEIQEEMKGVNKSFKSGSLGGLRRKVRQLQEEISDLVPGTEEFRGKLKELRSAKADLKQVEDGMAGINEEMEKGTEGGGFLQDALAGLGPALSIALVLDKIKDFVVGIFQSSNAVKTLRNDVERLFEGTPEQIDRTTARIEAIAQTFDRDAQEILVASNSVSKQLGISMDQTFDLIEKGFLAGADVSGEFLSILEEYPAQFKSAGLSAEESFALITKSIQDGVYADKGVDLVKEFNLRIREQTSATTDALDNAFGQDFTQDIFKGINEGSTTTIEALQQIAVKMDETEIPANRLQTVVADVFGGPGEDAGIDFIRSLAETKGGMDALIDTSSELTQYHRELLDAEEELALSEVRLAEASSGTGNGFKVVGTQIKTFFTDVIARFVEFFAPIFLEWFHRAKAAFQDLGKNLRPLTDLFQQLFGEISSGSAVTEAFIFLLDLGVSPLIRVAKALNQAFDSARQTIAAFKALGVVAPKVFSNIRDIAREALGGVSEMVAGIFTLDLDRIQKGLEDSARPLNSIIQDFNETAESIYLEAISEGAVAQTEERVEKISETIASGGDKINRETREQRKEREKLLEKAHQEELKLEQNLRALKAELIVDAFDREIAQLRAKAQDKIDALVGTPAQIDEQTKLLESALVRQIHEVEQKRVQSELKSKEKRDQEAEKQFKADLERLEGEDELRLLKVEESFVGLIDAERRKEQAIFEIQQEGLQNRLSLMEEAGKGESKEANKLRLELLKNQIDFQKEEVKNIRRTEELKQAIQEEGIDYAGQLFEVAEELLGKDEEARKKNATAIKAFAIGKVFIELQQEIAGYMGHPASTSSFGIAGLIKTGFASARAAAAIIKISNQKFAKGAVLDFANRRTITHQGTTRFDLGGVAQGARHDQGGIALVDSRSGMKVGEMEGGEPYMILSRNTYANNRPVVDRLLFSSMYRNGAPIFQNGGVLGAQAVAPEVNVNAPEGEGMEFLLIEMRGLREELRSGLAREARAVISYDSLNEVQQVSKNSLDNSSLK